MPLLVFGPLQDAYLFWQSVQSTAEESRGALCMYGDDYDPETLTPRGPRCGRPAIDLIFWRNGRYSSACEKHGPENLGAAALGDVICLHPIPGQVMKGLAHLVAGLHAAGIPYEQREDLPLLVRQHVALTTALGCMALMEEPDEALQHRCRSVLRGIKAIGLRSRWASWFRNMP
jgi:hypothetical protein